MDSAQGSFQIHLCYLNFNLMAVAFLFKFSVDVEDLKSCHITRQVMLSSNSHHSATENIAIHCLKRG